MLNNVPSTKPIEGQVTPQWLPLSTAGAAEEPDLDRSSTPIPVLASDRPQIASVLPDPLPDTYELTAPAPEASAAEGRSEAPGLSRGSKRPG